jgi:hypothetical protein
MPSTYHLYDRYGEISPSYSGETYFVKCKYAPSPAVLQQTNNRVYANDATADYSTYTLTGITGFYDAQFGVYGVGSARYYLDGSSLSPNIKIPSSSYYDTGTNTYKTASLKVWSKHTLTMRLDIQLQDSGGTQVGGTDSTTVTLVANEWTPIAVTSSVNGQRFLVTLNVMNFNASTDTGKIFYVDTVQVEDNRYQTPFNNSPVRVASTLNYSVPKIGPDYTVLCWTVAGPQVSSAAGGSHPFFTLYETGSSYATLTYQRGATRLQAFKDDTDPNTDLQISSLTVNPGTVMFGALVNDGQSLTAYFGKDGDASLQTVTGNTDFDYFGQVYLGQDPVNGTFANGPIEQFLIFNRVLTAQEIDNIFKSANPTDMQSDTSIIFAAGTPSLLGTTNALAVTGTGYLRPIGITASLDIISTSKMNSAITPFGTTTHMVYGEDVKKLAIKEVIATSTNLTTANLYRVDNIVEFPTAGKTAYVTKI